MPMQQTQATWFSWVEKIPWRRKWQPTPVFLPGKSHGQKSLEGYSLWSCKELDMTWVCTHSPIHHNHVASGKNFRIFVFPQKLLPKRLPVVSDLFKYVISNFQINFQLALYLFHHNWHLYIWEHNDMHEKIEIHDYSHVILKEWLT